MGLPLVVALASACSAVSSPPDADAYARVLAGAQRRQEEALSRYTYEVTETREDLDREGRVERRRTRGYEVFHVRGRPVRRLVSRDGRPLSAEDARLQQRRARERAEAIRSGEAASEQPAVEISRILERYRFRYAGGADLDGRCALAFELEARPGDFDLERDFLLRKLAGRLWVDEAEQAVVRLEVRNTGGVNILLGIGARLSSVTFRAEFVRAEEGVWLPQLLEGGVQGRKLLFVGFRVRERLAFGGFRRSAGDEPGPLRP